MALSCCKPTHSHVKSLRAQNIVLIKDMLVEYNLLDVGSPSELGGVLWGKYSKGQLNATFYPNWSRAILGSAPDDWPTSPADIFTSGCYQVFDPTLGEDNILIVEKVSVLPEPFGPRFAVNRDGEIVWLYLDATGRWHKK